MTAPPDLSKLSPDARRELLAKMLASRTAQADALSPCSYSQRSLWFMHQLAPTSSVYNVATAWRIRSAIDAKAMHRAFQAVVDRHEALRTTFESREGEPWQRVHARLADGFQTRVVGACDEAELMTMLVDDAKQPFNLETGPLLRATLFTRNETDHVLLVVIHHIACDLWSVEHILDDLRVLYRKESHPESDALSAQAPGRYRDFVGWQRAMLDGPEGEAHWQYWREKLRGNLPRLELPTDRPRPAVQSFVGDGVVFPIPTDLVAELRRYATNEGTTLFTVFLAAYQSLLVRYSGQDGVLVGSVTSGRSRREFEPMVGYFVNPIIFRCDTSDDPTFRDLLNRTRVDVLDALDHQDYPFPLLVERLKIERDASRSPLCDAYFVWDKTRDTGEQIVTEVGVETTSVQMDWHGVSLEAFPLTQVGTPSDLAMVVFEVGPTISVNIGFSTALFDRTTIERLGRHLVALLHAITANPDVPISQLPLITSEERDALQLPKTVANLPSLDAQSLQHRFETQAKRRPDAIAVSGASGRLTYRELDDRANALAVRLRVAGVSRDTIVGLYIERDVELAVAILGVLKAGGAYLPIDGAYPDERAAFMLEDSGAKLLLTQRSLAKALPGVSIARVFTDDPSADGRDVVEAGGAAHPDDVAYVIYTSGSTGKPKGVMVTHRNVMRLFDSTNAWYAFREDDVWSLFHSVAFDFSVWEFWGALLFGGRVVVVPYAVTRSPDDMLDLLASEGVTMLSQTPSAFRQLVAVDSARAHVTPLALRSVVFGGEALDVNTLRPWFERRGDEQPRLVNMYGITETTVHTTYRPITAADLGRRVRSPIGVALPDLHLQVLDSAGAPVPVGVPGELYVGGAGVARGYLNRPELTQTRFLTDPDSTRPNARLYRSGDLVRRLPDGDLEYLGRIDHQIKIRGFRVELGEIETALAAHAAIDHCAVVLQKDAAGDPRIIAYVVFRPGAEAPSAELQTFVRRSLPDYMVPAAFIRLAALPLTSSHKLDVNALPVPDQIESSSTRPYTAPRTDVERAVAVEWARLLGVERVGVDDDFFELGGHSILATGLARWIRDHFRIDFPVYAVFETPTVAGMAHRVDEIVSANAAAAEPAAAAREEMEL